MKTKTNAQWKNELKAEQREYKQTQSKLENLREKVLKDELPYSISEKSKQQIEFYIMQLNDLLIESHNALESAIDDLEQE